MDCAGDLAASDRWHSMLSFGACRTIRDSTNAFSANCSVQCLRTQPAYCGIEKARASNKVAAAAVAHPSLAGHECGRMVSREELRKSLWPDDTFVDFDHGLNNSINRIREVLCDSIASPRYIETIPKQGYRFLATLEELESAPAQAPPLEARRLAPTAANDPGSTIPKKPTNNSTTIGKSVLRVAQLVGLSALIISMGARSFPPDANQLHLRSVAVLPLSNLTGDPSQEFLADGMTDALITDLAQIRSIRVISRTSAMRYKASAKSLPEIAKELSVESIVEGSVARSGHRVRINAQLIDAQSDRHLWAKAYEGKMQDVLTLQSNVALAIASEIQTQMTPDEHQRIAMRVRFSPKHMKHTLRAGSIPASTPTARKMGFLS